MSNETHQNDINQDPNIQVSETVEAPAEETKESKKSHLNKASDRLKKWQHGFVELKINRQLHILLSVILMIGLIFGGAIEKIVIMLIAVPLLVSGITGVMFLEKLLTKMPWNKSHEAEKEVRKDAENL